MDEIRKQQIQQLLEACHETDNSVLEAEKTAVIGELLIEVENLEEENGSIPGVVSGMESD